VLGETTLARVAPAADFVDPSRLRAKRLQHADGHGTAPRGVLLLRFVLRASAALRSVRSASLLAPATGVVSPPGVSTGAAVTNVNSCRASISRISSLHNRR